MHNSVKGGISFPGATRFASAKSVPHPTGPPEKCCVSTSKSSFLQKIFWTPRKFREFSPPGAPGFRSKTYFLPPQNPPQIPQILQKKWYYIDILYTPYIGYEKKMGPFYETT